MKNEQDELVARVLEKLASGRNLTAEELTHLKALDGATDPSEAREEVDRDLSARTVAAVKKDRRPVYRRIAVVSLLLLMAAGLTTWWMLISFYVGHHTHFASRGEAMLYRLPGYGFLSALAAMAVGIVAGRLLPGGVGSRSVGLLTYASSTAIALVAYRVAVLGIQRDLRVYSGAMAVLMLAGIAMGLVIGRDALPFKRLGRGRQLSGVLAGIAREFGWKAWWLRVAFVLILVFLKVPVLLTYLFLDASMQVHPDDRANMWRFRIARWMRGDAATA